jgi:hypothetical protein
MLAAPLATGTSGPAKILQLLVHAFYKSVGAKFRFTRNAVLSWKGIANRAAVEETRKVNNPSRCAALLSAEPRAPRR